MTISVPSQPFFKKKIKFNNFFLIVLQTTNFWLCINIYLMSITGWGFRGFGWNSSTLRGVISALNIRGIISILNIRLVHKAIPELWMKYYFFLFCSNLEIFCCFFHQEIWNENGWYSKQWSDFIFSCSYFIQ